MGSWFSSGIVSSCAYSRSSWPAVFTISHIKQKLINIAHKAYDTWNEENKERLQIESFITKFLKINTFLWLKVGHLFYGNLRQGHFLVCFSFLRHFLTGWLSKKEYICFQEENRRKRSRNFSLNNTIRSKINHKSSVN